MLMMAGNEGERMRRGRERERERERERRQWLSGAVGTRRREKSGVARTYNDERHRSRMGS
jgi:hypothetical protein